MLKITLACLSCIAFCLQSQAQLFQNRIGKANPREFGNSVTQQVNGTYLIGGSYRNSFYGKDIPAIIHLNTNGSVDWVRQINLPNKPSSFVQYVEAVRSTTGTSDGYIALLYGSSSFFLVRLTNGGAVTWARRLSNAAFSSNYPLRVKPAYSSSNALPSFYILATHFSGQGEIVIKLNSAGNTLWQKRITHATSGFSYVFRDLKVTSDSGCVITGYGPGTAVIFKFSPTGSVTLAKSYDFFSATSSAGFGIAELSAGGYVVTGTEGGLDDNLTFKTTSTGAITWGYKYTNAASSDLYGKAVVTDALGNVIVTGAHYPGGSPNPPFLMKLNSFGTVVFAKEYDPFAGQYNTYIDANINDLKLTKQGYCFVGTASPSNVLSDIFIVQTNTSGNISSQCPPTTVSYSRVSADFYSVVNAGYIVVNETMKNDAVTVNAPKITTQELRCGTASPMLSVAEDMPGTLKAFEVAGSRKVNVEYKIAGTDNSNYEVKLVDLNGNVLASASIKANAPVVVNTKPLQNGIYVLSLSQAGAFITKQTIMIGQ